MSPKNAWALAPVVLVIGLGAAAVCLAATLELAVVMSVGLCTWLVVAGSYAWAGRRTHRAISERRRRGDMSVTAAGAVGLLLPCVLIWLAWITKPYKAPVDGTTIVVALTALLIAPVTVLNSTMFDWYAIRPFRDGAFYDPAYPTCHPPTDEDMGRRDSRAHWWAGHRMIAEFLGFGGCLVFAVILIVRLQDSSRTASDVLAYTGLAGILNILVARLLVRRVWPAFRYITAKTPGLGVWVEGSNAEGSFEGFVLDVSLDGMQVIRSPKENQPLGGGRVMVPLDQAQFLQAKEPPHPLCELKCEGWIRFDECERHLRARDAERRQASAQRESSPEAAPDNASI